MSSAFLPGIEPATFRSRGRRSSNRAIPTAVTIMYKLVNNLVDTQPDLYLSIASSSPPPSP